VIRSKYLGSFIPKIALFILAQVLINACGNPPADVIMEKSGQAALVFVKENSRFNNRSNAMRSNVDEYYPGTDIYILDPISPQGNVRNLTKQYTRQGQTREDRYGHAADPEISFDGKKILFSMRRNRDSNWHLYEMNIDGTNLNQLTDQVVGHDMDPVYLPNGQILFASTRPQIVDEYERRESPLLHVADRTADGRLTNIRQISFNQSHDTNPMVHSSGKVYYSRWEHLGDPNKFSIFAINPDGSRPFVLYGNHFPRGSGSRVYLDPRELADGGIICSLMERNSPFEGGAIAIKDISRGDDEINIITPSDVPFNDTENANALYRSPHPIIDHSASSTRKEKIIVSISPIPLENGKERQVDYGLYIMDKDGNNVRLIYNDPNFNEIDAVPVLPRDELPGGIPQVVPMDKNIVAGLASNQKTGIFFDGNVYHRDPEDRMMRPDANHLNKDGSIGQAKYVRVLSAVSMPRNRSKRGGEIGNTNLEKQRVVGYGDIRSDGSFSIEVPANISLHLQTLDENAMMLVSQRSWTHVMPGEKRLCTGCHDSHNKDKVINDLNIQPDEKILNGATGIFYKSGFNNAENVMAHKAAQIDTVDFFDRTNPTHGGSVQAVFDSNCISCHASSAPAGGLNLEMTATDKTVQGDNGNETTSVYETLTETGQYQTPSGDTRDYVTDDGARRSPLLWVLYNRQLNDDSNEDFSPSSYDHTALWKKSGGLIDPFDPANLGLLKIIEWVDMGTQYSNSVEK
jgi:hydrazine synthase alpha subunit-like protein